MTLALALITAALAGEPYRCEAVFTGPTRACELRARLSTTGTGKTESSARKAALRRLEQLVTVASEERLMRASSSMARAIAEQDVVSCAENATERAEVFCYAEPVLDQRKLCFATLRDRSCWRGAPIDIASGPSWRAMEQGREQLCTAMDAALIEDEASPVDRLSCQAACLSESSVRCIDMDG